MGRFMCPAEPMEGPEITRVTLELGGKSPNIVFDDADLDNAVKGAISGIFAATGQTCIAGSRLLVQNKIHNEFVDKLVAFAKTAEMGDPMSLDTQIGPVTTMPQFEKILGYLDVAKDEGAECVLGGARAERPECGDGWFVEPTIYTGVRNDMRIAQEEIFGPVIGVTTFKDEAEALAIANDTEYGLGAGVWTRDINRAYRMGRAIKAGRVWTNCYHLYPAHAAFGGYKKSGVGRETHKMILDHYQQTKNLLVSYDINPLGFF